MIKLCKLKSLIVFALLLQSCTLDRSIQKTTPEEEDQISQRSRALGCHQTITPDDSFSYAFRNMKDGELLCLADGVYHQIMNVPSNMNVRALNDGQAELNGNGIDAGWKGILNMRGDNSSVRGLKVRYGSYNASACKIGGTNNRVSVLSCSHGGEYKHAIPMSVTGSGHLIESSWFYGEGRYLLMCYQGDSITLRGNVFRWDKTKPKESGEPNAAMSNYSCSNTIWENNISLDYGKPETHMRHCGDICMSTTFKEPNYNVQFLGNMVINHHPDTGNNVAIMADQKSTQPSQKILVKDLYVRGVKKGIAVNPKYKAFSIENCTMINVERKILQRGTSVKCANDADIQYRYIDGVKTNQLLWPWPNESLIKNDMCAPNERQSDWCLSDRSLTDYVLNNSKD